MRVIYSVFLWTLKFIVVYYTLFIIKGNNRKQSGLRQHHGQMSMIVQNVGHNYQNEKYIRNLLFHSLRRIAAEAFLQAEFRLHFDEIRTMHLWLQTGVNHHPHTATRALRTGNYHKRVLALIACWLLIDYDQKELFPTWLLSLFLVLCLATHFVESDLDGLGDQCYLTLVSFA